MARAPSVPPSASTARRPPHAPLRATPSERAAGKPIRRPTFFYAGALGFLMSYLGRYRINEYKLLGYYPNPSECRWAGIEFKELRPPIGIEP